MSESIIAFPVAGVVGGRLTDDGEEALLQLHADGGALNLVLPAGELMPLLSVCLGLIGATLPSGGEAAHATIPVGDWRVGRTASQDLVIALAPEAGGALSFRLDRGQALELLAALGKALGLEPEPRSAWRPQDGPGRH